MRDIDSEWDGEDTEWQLTNDASNSHAALR